MKHSFLILVLWWVGVVTFTRADNWEVVGSSEFPLKQMQPLVFEGLCNDGEHFIMNTKSSIFIMNSTLDVLQSTLNAIPEDLLVEGYNHLGDCVCDKNNGMVYYAVEEPTKTKPSIFVYNLTTNGLIFIKEKSQTIQSHMPWVALDEVSGLLYSSEYDAVDQLRVYTAHSLDYLYTLPLMGQAAPLDQVQGGAFYQGKLYLGVNGGDSVYEVNVTTGAMELSIRQVAEGNKEYEFEGLTFLNLRHEGKGMMHNTGNHLHPQVMIHADLLTLN
jgi:hypothetical protein